MANAKKFDEMFKMASDVVDADFSTCYNMAAKLRDNLYDSIKERMKVINTRDITVLRCDVEKHVVEELSCIRKYFKDEDKPVVITNIVMQYLACLLVEDGAHVCRTDLKDAGSPSDLVITFFPDPDTTYLTVQELNEILNEMRREYIH